jgi:hypothetical protein
MESQMNEEWKDLPTLPDVGAAQLEGWEIQRLNTVNPTLWSDWDGCAWVSHWAFRGRPRQPKMKKVTSFCYRAVNGALLWDNADVKNVANFLRFPAGDFEGEIPDDN